MSWELSHLDLSEGKAGMHIFSAVATGRGTIRNCKLPASWSGSLVTGTLTAGERYEMHNCDSGDTNYRMIVTDYCGSITTETTIKVTAGASDGTTGISWKMVSSAGTEPPFLTLDTPEIVIWNETTGSPITVTVEFLIDSATTLYTGDVWMDVMYLGTSGFPIGSVDTDSGLANILSANTTECTTGVGVGSWSGDGAGAKSYKLVSTITPQEKGYIHAVIHLAKASTTIYVDPNLTVA
jgi:hypothetical protein